MEEGVKQLGEIAKSTNNDAIILIIVLILGVVVAAIPLYKMVVKAQKEKRQQYFEREQIMVGVLKEVAEVLAGLKTVIETTYGNCAACKEEQVDLFHQINEKQDQQLQMLTKITTMINERLERRTAKREGKE